MRAFIKRQLTIRSTGAAVERETEINIADRRPVSFPDPQETVQKMWRDDLKLAVEFYASDPPMIDPIFLWSVNRPSNAPWPEKLPSCDSLLDFYALCDGGYFGPMMNFLAKVDLPVQTNKWVETLRNYDDNGDVLIPQRHLVIANDADGAPWIFDGADQSVQCYYWKSGEWCDPRYDSHDEFMDAQMYKDPNSADWIKALEIMRQTIG